MEPGFNGQVFDSWFNLSGFPLLYFFPEFREVLDKKKEWLAFVFIQNVSNSMHLWILLLMIANTYWVCIMCQSLWEWDISLVIVTALFDFYVMKQHSNKLPKQKLLVNSNVSRAQL